MKKLLFIIPILLFVIGNVQSQEVKKTEEKKVVIIKKKTDENGKVIKERIEATGEDADKLLKELKESGELEDVDIEIMMDEKVKVIKKKEHSEKEHKTIKVEVDKKDLKEKGSFFIELKKDGEEGSEVKSWNFVEGEVPEEVKELIESGKIRIEFEDEDGKSVNVMGAKEEKMPEVNVRMGIRVIGTGEVIISEVEDGSSAQKAGLQKDDVITEIDDYQISSYKNLMQRLSEYKAGDKINVRYIRNGKAQTTSLKLEGRE